MAGGRGDGRWTCPLGPRSEVCTVLPARDPEPQQTTLLEHPPCTKAAQSGPGPCPLAQLPTTSSLAKLSLHTNYTHSLPWSLRQVTFGLDPHTHTHTQAILSLGHRTKNLPQYSRITATSTASQTIAPEHGPVNPQPLKHTPTAIPLPGTHVHVVSRGVHPAHPTPALHRSSLGTFRISGPKEPHKHTPVMHILMQLPRHQLTHTGQENTQGRHKCIHMHLAPQWVSGVPSGLSQPHPRNRQIDPMSHLPPGPPPRP